MCTCQCMRFIALAAVGQAIAYSLFGSYLSPVLMVLLVVVPCHQEPDREVCATAIALAQAATKVYPNEGAMQNALQPHFQALLRNIEVHGINRRSGEPLAVGESVGLLVSLTDTSLSCNVSRRWPFVIFRRRDAHAGLDTSLVDTICHMHLHHDNGNNTARLLHLMRMQRYLN